MGLFSRWSLKYRLHLSNVLFLIILIVLVALYFNSKKTTNDLLTGQQSFNQSIAKVRTAAMDVKDYLAGNKSFEGISQEFNGLSTELKDSGMGGAMASLQQSVEAFHELRAKNEAIALEIDGLTAASIKNSNGFIEMVSKKLADEKTRSEVTTLERMTIVGASINTSSNYEIKVRFLRVKENLANKGSLLKYLDTLTTNVDKDIKQLTGTPFVQMALSARDLNFKVKELVGAYITNIEKQGQVQKSVFDTIEKILSGIEAKSLENNKVLLGSIQNLFKVMVIFVLVVGLLGIVLTSFLASSVSKALKSSVDRLAATSARVKNASGQVSGASQHLAEGTSQQAAGIQETSSSLEEMASMTRANSDNAAQADTLMNQTKAVVKEAGEAMAELAASMDRIGQSGREIGNIVKSIDEIAFQTNLLALNAAVEAARAGEAGAGFAVVADEVRALALRAAEAASNTQELITGTVQQIGQGTELVEKTADAFGHQAELADKVANLISEVAGASSEQAQGVDQINSAVTQMDQVVQRNAASAEESAAASQNLYSLSDTLTGVVRQLNELVGGSSRTGAGQEEWDSPADYSSGPGFSAAVKNQGQIKGPRQIIPFDED